MPNYNFLNLSAYEFEELSRDLLQKELNSTFESFADGKDQGIDFLYSKKNNFIILQCKRYEKYSQLKSSLKKELKKIKLQNPTRYILSTSVKLSFQNKKEIKSLLSPFILETKDVLGQKDLNNLISKNPEIERQHFKLWLTSTNVLHKILNATVINQSKFEQNDIEDKLKLYVKNDSFYKAVKILNDNRFIIISGIPGIGKTTLARMLVCYYLGRRYKQFINISQKISEAISLCEDGIKQVFLFDDFLGRINLSDNDTHNKDLMTFISHIKNRKNKILIFTTREYILNQATQLIEKFKDLQYEEKIILDLKEYSEEAKARILYNHLFFANLKAPYLKNIIEEKRYLQIINHQTYSPRIVEYITKKEIIKNISPDEFFTTFINYLNTSTEIWDHAYKRNIKDISKTILCQLILLTSNNPIFLEDLESATSTFYHGIDKNFDHDEFMDAIHELENCFIKTNRDLENNFIVDFQNPSIENYLISKLNNDPSILNKMIPYTIYFEQLTTRFYGVTHSKDENRIKLNSKSEGLLVQKLENDFTKLKMCKLRKEVSDKGFSYKVENYSELEKMHIIYFSYPNNPNIKQFVSKELSNYLQRESYYYPLSKVILLITKLKDDLKIDIKEVLLNIAESLDYLEEFEEFCLLKDLYEDEFREVIDELGLQNLITNQFDKDLKDTDDIRKMDELYEMIEKIESEYDFDFFDQKTNLISKISSIIKKYVKSENDLDELYYLSSDLEDLGYDIKSELRSDISTLDDKIWQIEVINKNEEEELEQKETNKFLEANLQKAKDNILSETTTEETIDNMFNSLLVGK
jgi:DNA polymerase III delta prime subunit